MALDPEVRKAIVASVQNAKQPEAASKRLVAWLESLSDGKTSLESDDDVRRHVESVLQAIKGEQG
jgi:hypothetical protein